MIIKDYTNDGGFSKTFMESLDYLLNECLKEMEALNIYEEKTETKE